MPETFRALLLDHLPPLIAALQRQGGADITLALLRKDIIYKKAESD